jgi:hypothetical protein
VSAFATLDDYTVRTGQSALSTAQAARITALLDDASALIRSQLPTGYEPDADLEALLSGWDEGCSGAYTVGLRDDAFPPCPTLPYHPPYRYRDRRERYGRRW